jgi:hypothetical protein
MLKLNLIKRLFYEISVLLILLFFIKSTLWIIPMMLFGLIYQPIIWFGLEKIISPKILISIFFVFICRKIIYKRKVKSIKDLAIQDLILIVIGVPFSNSFLSLFNLDVDSGLRFPYPLIYICILTVLVIQLNHYFKFKKLF